MTHAFAQYALCLITLLSLAACGVAEPPAAQTSATPIATTSAGANSQSAATPKIGSTDTLLTIRTRGGLCRYGPCWSEKYIRADGSYHATDGTGAQKDGTLDDAKVAELMQLIAAANFDEIRSQPFTGTCPTASDGQELIYTFQTPSGEETIASCEIAIDANSPLFQHIAALLDTLNQ